MVARESARETQKGQEGRTSLTVRARGDEMKPQKRETGLGGHSPALRRGVHDFFFTPASRYDASSPMKAEISWMRPPAWPASRSVIEGWAASIEAE